MTTRREQTMLSLDEFMKRVSLDLYGGSAELVDDGIDCFIHELRTGEFPTAQEVLDKIEACVDGTLSVCNAIFPLINLLDLCMRFVEDCAHTGLSAGEVVNEAIDMLASRKLEQSSYLERIGEIGERMVPDGAKFSTFSTSGSVMAILQKIHAAGKRITLTCHESRPHSEGYRTFREVAELGFPVTIGTDAAITDLIPGADIFVIGADGITSTGQVFAKMGSYLAALACKEFGIPFYVAADTSKFDILSLLGFPIKDSSRPYREVSDMEVPDGCRIANTTFELIPPYLITGIITEKGLISPASVSVMMEPEKMSQKMIAKAAVWNNQ